MSITIKLRIIVLVGWLSVIANASAETLVIGRVSGEPEKTYRQLKPIVEYVVSKLHDVGITNGSVLVAKDQTEMIRYLKEGKVDWIQKGVFDALVFSKEAGAEIALRSWREGVPSYYAVIFSRKDTNINSLKDLVGKKIAFQDRDSNVSILRSFRYIEKVGF